MTPERRESDWTTPRFWLSVIGTLLTICIVIGSYILSQLNMLVVASTEERTERKAIIERVEKLERWHEAADKDKRDDDKRFSDYTFSIGKQLSELQGEANVKKEK